MDDKSYVIESGAKALEERLVRTGRKGSVTASKFAACFEVRSALPYTPLVSIVIPSAGKDRRIGRHVRNLLSHCLETLVELSTYRNYEIIVVDNGDLSEALQAVLVKRGCRQVTYKEAQFNISKKLNLGAGVAKGEYLLFLNDDIEVIKRDWIEAMLEQGTKAGVGVVGAKLLYENGTLQHVGVVHREGLPDHVRKHYPRSDPGYMFSTVSVRNYMAVTGACMLTKAELFRKAGGFDEEYKINYSDIDYCLKLREMGYRCVYTPHAELYHFESASRPAEVAQEEIERYRKNWGSVTKVDPYYNATYLQTSPPDFTLRLPE
jgi:GT2 family glycosyltransferase